MHKYGTIGIFGIFIWIIPFLISFLIFDIRETNRPLFESIMPVILTFVVLLFSILYYNKQNTDFLKNGISLGIAWFIINILIDLLLFLPESQFQMTITDYIMDIGLTYIIILMIPISIGYILEKK